MNGYNTHKVVFFQDKGSFLLDEVSCLLGIGLVSYWRAFDIFFWLMRIWTLALERRYISCKGNKSIKRFYLYVKKCDKEKNGKHHYYWLKSSYGFRPAIVTESVTLLDIPSRSHSFWTWLDYILLYPAKYFGNHVATPRRYPALQGLRLDPLPDTSEQSH